MPNAIIRSRLAALLLIFFYTIAGGFAIVPKIEYAATKQSCSLMGFGNSSCCCKTASIPLAGTACLMNAPCSPGAPAGAIEASGNNKHLAGVGPSAGIDPVAVPAPAASAVATYPPQPYPIDKVPIPAI
jgi:hypothetical protein